MSTATLNGSNAAEAAIVISEPRGKQPRRSAPWMDTAFEWLTRSFAFLVFSLLAAILVSLMIGSQLSLEKYGFSFIWSEAWNPVTEEFGALVPIFGTVVTSLIAMLIGVPVSFGIALFLTELSPAWLKRPLGTAIELLAAIPSIIYGMWGLFVFAPIFQSKIQPLIIDSFGSIPLVGALFAGPPIGIGMLTAGVILSIMVIPFITAVMRDVFELVPPLLKESVRLKAPPGKSSGVVRPTQGLCDYGIMPPAARGETMAVTFVIGNAHRLATSLMAPGNSIASALANEFTEAVGDLYFAALYELGLILFLITTVVLALSKLLLMQLAKGEGAQT
jgi:phosphate transport system permease protein